jgi:hypothetical protein
LRARVAWFAHWRSLPKARASGANPCSAWNSRASPAGRFAAFLGGRQVIGHARAGHGVV